MKFRTTLLLEGKSATGLLVPDEVVAELAHGRKPPVTVTINDFTYRSTIAARGGRYLIPVSADIRRQAGVAAGDEVDVALELDTAPRQVVVPSDLADRLAAEPTVQAVFSRLSYSHQLAHVLAIEQAKTPETRERRIVKALEGLRQASTG